MCRTFLSAGLTGKKIKENIHQEISAIPADMLQAAF
jgi:hypothetical protein